MKTAILKSVLIAAIMCFFLVSFNKKETKKEEAVRSCTIEPERSTDGTAFYVLYNASGQAVAMYPRH